MKAMILAAGLGTRLRPLTNDRPKALVTVGGRTLLEIAIERLRAFGVREVIVNAHHFAEQIEEYLRARANFGMRIEVSREEELLDTGGGLKKAAWFFLGSGGDCDEPFLVHNVDVISTIDLAEMMKTHRASGALSTLAVQDRKTLRYLLFDGEGALCGRRAGLEVEPESLGAVAQVEALAFCGIHVIRPRLLALLNEQGGFSIPAFSIIDAYLRLAAAGEKISAFRADAYAWRDVGKPESLAEAERAAFRLSEGA